MEGIMANQRANRVATIVAFIVWVVFGQIGGAAGPSVLQNLTWAISSMGLVTGCALSMIRLMREERDVVAAGFATLAIGGAVIWSGGPGSATSLGAAMIFFAPGLLLISAPAAQPIVSRAAGAVAAMLFATHAGIWLSGRPISATDRVSIAGYVAMTVAVIGWTVALVRALRRRDAVAPTVSAAMQ
jgi:hypothetical protein